MQQKKQVITAELVESLVQRYKIVSRHGAWCVLLCICVWTRLMLPELMSLWHGTHGLTNSVCAQSVYPQKSCVVIDHVNIDYVKVYKEWAHWVLYKCDERHSRSYRRHHKRWRAQGVHALMAKSAPNGPIGAQCHDLNNQTSRRYLNTRSFRHKTTGPCGAESHSRRPCQKTLVWLFFNGQIGIHVTGACWLFNVNELHNGEMSYRQVSLHRGWSDSSKKLTPLIDSSKACRHSSKFWLL
jgi:hypothetical protein